MININESFLSEEAARDYKEYMLRQFHPMGYGTSLRVAQSKQDGLWSVNGYRFASCD